MRVVIGTPMYGGQCFDRYAMSVGRLRHYLKQHDVDTGLITLGNESLIGRARDAIVWRFLDEGSASYLLFLDADVGVRPVDIWRMIQADHPLTVAPVPMKAINWERVRAAAIAGVPAEELHLYSGFFNAPAPPEEADFDQAWSVLRGGAAVMLIKREVFEKIDAANLARHYHSHNHDGAVPFGTKVINYFPTPIRNGELLPEDYAFCSLWKATGGDVALAPWCEVTHTGTHTFTGLYRARVPRLPQGE